MAARSLRQSSGGVSATTRVPPETIATPFLQPSRNTQIGNKYEGYTTTCIQISSTYRNAVTCSSLLAVSVFYCLDRRITDYEWEK